MRETVLEGCSYSSQDPNWRPVQHMEWTEAVQRASQFEFLLQYPTWVQSPKFLSPSHIGYYDRIPGWTCGPQGAVGNMDLNFTTSESRSSYFDFQILQFLPKVNVMWNKRKEIYWWGFRTSILRADGWGRVVSEIPPPCTVLPKEPNHAGLQVFWKSSC